MTTTSKQKIALGFNPHETMEFKNALNCVSPIRECLSNAVNYGATKAYFATLSNPFKDGKTHLLACMHNTPNPFEDTQDITGNGLVPNQSGGVGVARHGSGLMNSSNWLSFQPGLIIASNTLKEGWVVAGSKPNFHKNEYATELYPDFIDQVIKPYLGTKAMEEFPVMYFFHLQNLQDNKHPRLNEATINLLPFIAPEIMDQIVCSVASGIHDPQMLTKEGNPKGPLFGNTVADEESYKRKNRGSADRPIVPKDEFLDRYQETSWSFNSTGTLPNKAVVEAEITIRAFPCTPSTEAQNKNWMGNLRDGFSKRSGHKFSKGGGAGPGKMPSSLLYMFTPLIADGTPENKRFEDNAVFFSNPGTEHETFLLMGLPFSAAAKASAVVEVRLTKYQPGDDVDPTSDLPCILRTRPDFLVNREIARSIIKAVCKNATPPDECKKWFKDHFPKQLHQYTPITLSIGNNTQKSNISPNVYDLETGSKLDKKIKCGKKYVVAIQNPYHQKSLVTTAESSAHNRGIEIRPYVLKQRDLSLANKAIQQGYLKLRQQFEKNGILDKTQEMPLFTITVSDREKLENGTWLPCAITEYQHDHNHRPSRSIQAILDQENWRIATILDVPARPGKGVPPRKVSGGTKVGVRRLNEEPYGEYDPRRAVFWNEKEEVLYLNLKHPVLKVFGVTDSVGSPSQKRLSELYQNILAFSAGIKESLDISINGNWEGKIVDDEGNEIFANASDYMLNKYVNHFLAESSYIQDVLAEVDNCRHKSSLAS